jgi:hypothetical protein
LKNLKTYNSSFTYQLKGLSNGATLALITYGSTVHYKAKLIRMAMKIILTHSTTTVGSASTILCQNVITINVPVVYMARYVMVFRHATSL